MTVELVEDGVIPLQEGETAFGKVGPHYLYALRPGRLKLLDKNARVMTMSKYRRLVENVRRDGGLASSVLCWLDQDGNLEVLSGNHRTQAAREAEIEFVPVMLITEALTRDEAIAIQLSHNAISGEDDQVILRELWEEIGTIDAKDYAGLDDKTLGELAAVDLTGLSEVNLNYQSLTFLFLPEERDRAIAALDAAQAAVGLRGAVLARSADYSRLLDDLAVTKAAYDIRNGAVGLAALLDIFEAHLGDLVDGWYDEPDVKHKGMVPMASIFGTDMIPAETAQRLKRAVEKLSGADKELQAEPWRVLDIWAEQAKP